jgi:hypothetical protein
VDGYNNKQPLRIEDLETLLNNIERIRQIDLMPNAALPQQNERLEGVWELSVAIAASCGEPLNRINLHTGALLHGLEADHPLVKHVEGIHACLVQLKREFHKTQSIVRYVSTRDKAGKKMLDLDRAIIAA